MTSNYDLKPLTQVCEVLSGGTPKTTVPEFWNGNIPWASVKDFNIDSRWFSKTEKSISQLGLDSCSSVLLEPGDLVISARGTVGVVGQCKMRTSFNQSNYGLRAKSALSKNDYLYYALSYAKRALIGDTHGGMFDTITRDTLDRLLIPVPTLKVQEQIAEILGSLDMKIAVNNALSKTLEIIAQTIFKSWFIDFDPVKAKMAGEKPAGMEAATAELFPDSMEESELGVIPQGWEWKSIGDIAHVIDCLHSKKPQLLSEGFPYLQLDTISDSGVLYFENAGRISKEDYEKWTSRIEVEGGDCLITNVGRVGAISQVPRHFKAAIGRNITAIRPKDSRLHQSFLIVSLLSDFMKREISNKTDSGTILEALNVKNIPKLLIPGPSTELLLEFAKVCDPIQSQIQELHAINVNLRKIRDSLLPRLISGELQIPEEMLAS